MNPLNTIYHSLSNTEAVIDSLNPLSNTDSSDFHLIVEDKTNFDVFIYKNKIYFI